MAKRKRGRPPKPEDERRSVGILIKLTEAERELLQRAAGDEKTITWARDVLLRAAKRRLT